MAAESDPELDYSGGRRLRIARLKGQLFEVSLIAATLVGILSLVLLFAQITVDAVGPFAASPQWFVVYLGTVVTPTAVYTLYVRKRPAARDANARAFTAAFGGTVLALAAFVVIDALSPYDVLIYAAFATVPPVLVWAVGRRTGATTYIGPSIPLSIVGGLAFGAVSYAGLRPFVGVLAQWIAYLLLITVPVAMVVGGWTARRRSNRQGLLAAAVVLAGALLIAVAGIAVDIEPSFWIVLFSAGVVPFGYVAVDEIAIKREGTVGVLGPLVVLGGVLVGVAIERTLAIRGPDGYLTPTLLTNSWDGLTASNAGVYPQIVGSIIIVGFMAIMAFPIGAGAAIYLEEYAPSTGLGGWLATVLEVNISNLAGVPSVVYGLLGLALFRNALGFGPGLVVSAAATLGLLILPIVVVSAQEAIRSVPDSLRQASYGMGASRWQTLREVVIPESIPGILTGTILALGRAIGETAPLVIIAVATTTYSPPSGLFDGATALPLQIFASASNARPAFRTGVVAATAVVLLALMLTMNAIAIVMRNRYENER
ncbi:phosphate ABC transporter permease PstA [Halanaeroarchaeum sulfurireducens]|uniref:Phosphate transport system permease protein PstA n=1 Tax=Halanaeroarchaeum sulfurireducens TaxID=1604004 RepID=A0A0F7P908_9EURY|nr:phosphate ABC transporter permease PstA [Halanaeroarchaeum sulfurireducens]AKH97237.1 phosphate ABC transporter, permease protein PstA [Halanaeroarchaeum sulfurireducens]ALG81639.1 phosphate ABC transporter, permease protein PstA [Halanaeroarchaeum sulfurireducens]